MIVLIKTFDFAIITTTAAAYRAINKCFKGQDIIKTNYDPNEIIIVAIFNFQAILGINIANNKILISIGFINVIKGKGFRINFNFNNVIVQNIHIITINSQYVWKGDGISVEDADGV
jgi:pectin lyase